MNGRFIVGIVSVSVTVIIALLGYMVMRGDKAEDRAGSDATTTAMVQRAKEQLTLVESRQEVQAVKVAEHDVEIRVLKVAVKDLTDSSKETNRALWRLIGAIENEVAGHEPGGPIP